MTWFAKGNETVAQPPTDSTTEVPPDDALVVHDKPPVSTEMVALGDVQRALAAVDRVEDVKAIRDKAEAMRKYVESAGLGLEMQNKAAELKLRAERKAGEMLGTLRLHGGKRTSDDSAEKVRLDDLGISKDQSSRWQLLARLPAEVFDGFIDEVFRSGEELTTARALRFARQSRRSERPRSRTVLSEGAGGVIQTLAELLEGEERFGCLMVDPPWPPDSNEAAVVEQVAGLPVGGLAAEQSHLHLWTPDEHLFNAQAVLDAWGFALAGVFVWVNPKRGPGPYWRCAHELLLLGVRGDCAFRSKTTRSWVEANRRRDRSRPTRIRELLETVSPGPYAELFTSQPARGWTCCAVSDDFTNGSPDEPTT